MIHDVENTMNMKMIVVVVVVVVVAAVAVAVGMMAETQVVKLSLLITMVLMQSGGTYV